LFDIHNEDRKNKDKQVFEHILLNLCTTTTTGYTSFANAYLLYNTSDTL